jgi:hypothetical protein
LPSRAHPQRGSRTQLRRLLIGEAGIIRFRHALYAVPTLCDGYPWLSSSTESTPSRSLEISAAWECCGEHARPVLTSMTVHGLSMHLDRPSIATVDLSGYTGFGYGVNRLFPAGCKPRSLAARSRCRRFGLQLQGCIQWRDFYFPGLNLLHELPQAATIRLH